jgi:hypothetical protein
MITYWSGLVDDNRMMIRAGASIATALAAATAAHSAVCFGRFQNLVLARIGASDRRRPRLHLIC